MKQFFSLLFLCFFSLFSYAQMKESRHATAFCPEPIYPRNSERLEQEGKVQLLIRINKDNSLNSVTLEKSSGHKNLDNSVLDLVPNCQLSAELRNGIPVDSANRMSMDFTISDSGSRIKISSSGNKSYIQKLYSSETHIDDERLLKYKSDALNGDLGALLFLGALYREGSDVPQNFSESIIWYKMAAEKNNALAQYYLGVMLSDKKSNEKDLNEALKWFQLAASSGIKEAGSEINTIKKDLLRLQNLDRHNLFMSSPLQVNCRKAIESKYNYENIDKYGRSTHGMKTQSIDIFRIPNDDRYKKYGYLEYNLFGFRFGTLESKPYRNGFRSYIDCVYDKKIIILLELKCEILNTIFNDHRKFFISNFPNQYNVSY